MDTSTKNCPDSLLFSQHSTTGALRASFTTQYYQPEDLSPPAPPLKLHPLPIDQGQPTVISLPLLRSAAQRSAATPQMETFSGLATLPHDALSQALAPQSSSSQLPPSSLVSASSADPLSSTAATPDKSTDGSEGRKQSSKMFRCTGFGDCQMTFTRSEHLARHVRKHTGERPFKCHCGRTFSRLDNVRQHAATVHAELAVQNAQCISDLVALHNSLSASTMQKQRDAGMIVQDQQREAAKARKKADAADSKPPRKNAAANAGTGVRRKGMAAEKKAREQAEAAEAREKREKEQEEAANQQQQQQEQQQQAAIQQEGSSISGSVHDGASSYPVSPPSAPAPPSIPSAYASPYSNQSFVAPPPSTGNMPYPSYGQSTTTPSYGHSMGMYGSSTGVEHLYGYPPPSSSQQQPPSPVSSSNFYPPPQTQSPHTTDLSSRDHHRSTSSQLNSSQNGDNRYASTSALGYPSSSSSTAVQGYPTDQNKVSLPSISALLPPPFSRPDGSGSSSNPPDSQPQATSAPINDQQNAYYGNVNAASRSQYGYPLQGDLAQQQQQFAMSQASMYPPYDPYARPPSAGTSNERGDNPPSLSNGSSSTVSSSFPTDSSSNQQLHDAMSQTQQHNPYSHLYHSPYPAPPHSYASAMMYGAPHLSYHQQAATSPYAFASQYASQHYPTSHPSKYPYPSPASYAIPSPLQMHSQPPPQPQHHIHFHLNAAGQPHSTTPSHVSHEENNAPRSTPLYAPPTYQHPHTHTHAHSRDNSTRSSIASPAPGWAPPPVSGGLLNGGEQSMQHSNSQNGGGGSGMFSGPTNILKRDRDEDDLYSQQVAAKRRMYEDQHHNSHGLAIGR